MSAHVLLNLSNQTNVWPVQYTLNLAAVNSIIVES